MTIQLTDRDIRQRDLIPSSQLAETDITIIGVGAIGRQVTLQLAAIGAPFLQLIDPDTVEVVNLASQGYLLDDLGREKVHATTDLAHQINPQIQITAHVQRFQKSQAIGNTVFCCVDSIDTRRHIWRAVQDQATFLVDGRMSAEVIRILTVSHGNGVDHYPETLFQAEEAFTGSCTAKSTIYTASIAAGLMIQQFTRHLRHLPIDPDLQLNLLASELNVQ